MLYVKKKGYEVLRMCSLLHASRSGFYRFLEAKIHSSKKLLKKKALEEKIETLFNENKERYGSPRIYRELRNSDSTEIVGENKVAKIMRLKNLSARRKSSCPPRTKRDEVSPKAPRLFKVEESVVKKENEVWCSDLTYIPFRGKFLYLVVFLDVFQREVKSWDLCEGMEAVYSQKALREAIKSIPGKVEGLVIHSDQGVQYCSKVFREELEFFKLKQSMSRKGNCYDNAFVESFFHTLKTELNWKECRTKEELKEEIGNYIEWYNSERMHSSLGYLSPKEFKKRSL